MQIELVTKQDLDAFKNELLEILRPLMQRQNPADEKEFLRSKDVRRLLSISSGTLQNLRVKGLLHPTKIEGVFYYKLSEINTLLSAGAK